VNRRLVVCLLAPLATASLVVAQEGGAEDPLHAVVRDEQGRPRLAGELDVLVGMVRANSPRSARAPSEYVLEDGALWRGSNHRVGHTNVFDLDHELEPMLPGRALVAVYGERGSLDESLTRVGPAPGDYFDGLITPSLRDDWTSPECGFEIGRSTHGRLRELESWSGRTAVRLDDMIRLTAEGEQWRIQVANPFDGRLEGLTVTLQYEKVVGRPLAPWEVEHALDVAPGEAWSVTAPTTLNDDRRGDHGLAYVRIEGQVGKALFDVSWPTD
jgi:hypothetical protein